MKKKSKKPQKTNPKTNSKKPTPAEARRDALIFLFSFEGKLQLPSFSVEHGGRWIYFFYFYCTKVIFTWKPEADCALVTTWTATSKAQLIFSDSVTKTPATRIVLKGASLFLLSSSSPLFQTCSSAAYFVLSLTHARPLCETLSHGEAAESKTRKQYYFFPYQWIKVIYKGPDRCQSKSKTGGKAAKLRRRGWAILLFV